VNLQDACLDEGNEPLEAINGQHWLALADIDTLQTIIQALPSVLGVEALPEIA
jgi:hypothetical protein